MDKIIQSFNLDLSDLPAISEKRSFTIEGDNGAEFILEIKDNTTGYYYNFFTNDFQAAYAKLEKSIGAGNYKDDIIFPAVTGSDDQYDIYLRAKPGTKHSTYNEVRFGDGSIDINSSIGSSSLALQKVIYQYSALTLTLQGYSLNSTVTGTLSTDTISINRGKNAKKSFSFITTAGATASYKILKQPEVSDILAYTDITVGAAAEVLPGETTASDTLFYQWPVDNIDKVRLGNKVHGTNVTSGPYITNYEDTVTINEGTENEQIIVKNKAPFKDTKGQKPTIVKGLVTVQPGNIVLNQQNAVALAGDAIKIFGYGKQSIKSITGYEVVFTNLAIALTSITTTTTSAVSSSATVPVASVNGVLPSTTTVSGIGIDPSVANPTVDSRSVTSGAGNIVLDAAQTLESGVTLTFGGGAGQIATITGNIEIVKAGTSDETIYFDLEKLLSIS